MRPLVIIFACVMFATTAPLVLSETRPANDDVKFELDALTRQMDTGNRERDFRELQRLIQALASLPAADERRLIALALAGKYAKAGDLSAQAKSNLEFRRDHFRLHMAWTILQSLGVIREGAVVEDLVPILGTPSKRYDHDGGIQTWRWYYGSPMHVNPALDIKVKENKVVGVELNRA